MGTVNHHITSGKIKLYRAPTVATNIFTEQRKA
jgi:hypothetical protein